MVSAENVKSFERPASSASCPTLCLSPRTLGFLAVEQIGAALSLVDHLLRLLVASQTGNVSCKWQVPTAPSFVCLVIGREVVDGFVLVGMEWVSTVSYSQWQSTMIGLSVISAFS